MSETDHPEFEQSIEEHIAILKEKQTPAQSRLEALFYLVQHFTTDFYDLFESLLQDETESPQVQSAVALSLGKLAGERSLSILSQYVKTENPVVRNYVIQALGMTRYEAAMPYLIQALGDKDNNVFASASEAISQIGEPAIPYLSDVMDSGADDARCVAAWNMGEIRSPQSLPSLLKVIREDQSVEVIALAIWALGQIGAYSTEVIETLRDAVQRPEPDVRLRADVALKKISLQFN